MVVKRLLGPYGKLPILIRDDDTNFFTKTNMLETIYSKAWEKGFKVSLGVIPSQKGTNNISVPPEFRMSNSIFPVVDNNSLVRYVKNKISMDKIEVLQHGFSHYIAKDGRWEFGEDGDKKTDIEFGKDILKKAFDICPQFFVPPGEEISKQNIVTLIRSGLVPICRETIVDTLLRSPYVPILIKDITSRLISSRYRDRVTNGNGTVQFLKPVIITIRNRLISWSVPLRSTVISSFESLFELTNKIIESCSLSRSPVCIINHYHLYYYDWNSSISETELFRSWTKILQKFDGLEFAWKTTFSELYERAEQIQKIQIVETGSKITIESKVRIKGFSLRTKHHLEPSDSILFDKETKIVTFEDLVPSRKIVLYEKN